MIWEMYLSRWYCWKSSKANEIVYKKLYVTIVTLSTQDNVKLHKQIESGFKRTINWKKYQTEKKNLAQNRYLDFFIYPGFQVVGRRFVLSCENENSRESYKQYYLPVVETKDYNVMIGGRTFFDQTVKNYLRKYDNIQKIATGQGDGYTTGRLQDYSYFKECYKLIAIDLDKLKKLDADSKAIQKINFAWNLNRAEGATKFFINGEAKEAVLDFSKATVNVLWLFFFLI